MTAGRRPRGEEACPRATMRAIELYPYWDDNRALLDELIAPLTDADLGFSPAHGLSSLGAVLRHIITTEEHWWYGGILGKPYSEWRPEGWERFTTEQRSAYRTQRFPAVASVRAGLIQAHAPVAAFLRELDAWALCERRRATWGETNALRWIFWHLVEHDQHHRAQVYTRVRMLGYRPPPLFPRPDVMGWTPAAHWRPGEEEIEHIVPYWDRVHALLRRAVGSLAAPDLAFRPSAGLPTVRELILHTMIWQDFLIQQISACERGDARALPMADGTLWQVPADELGRRLADRLATVESLMETLETVHRAVQTCLARLRLPALVLTLATPWGPQVLHHALWYAREHTVHHRAQLFLRMRMLGYTPPEP